MRFAPGIWGILAISLLIADCSDSSKTNSPQYLAKLIHDNPPVIAGLTPYPTHGPYTRRVAHAEIGRVRDFAATDFQLWIKDPPPATVWRSANTGPLSLVRFIDKYLYIDGPQGFAVSEEGLDYFDP